MEGGRGQTSLLNPCKVQGFPHARGDGPVNRDAVCAGGKFSPRAWGWSGCLQRRPDPHEVFPTRVGMVREHVLSYPCHVGFPHARGDGPPNQCRHRTRSPFSPRAWGWSEAAGIPDAGSEVFPTRVGMVRGSHERRGAGAGFPHARGDGPWATCPECGVLLFSPRAWGWSEAAHAYGHAQAVLSGIGHIVKMTGFGASSTKKARGTNREIPLPRGAGSG